MSVKRFHLKARTAPINNRSCDSFSCLFISVNMTCIFSCVIRIRKYEKDHGFRFHWIFLSLHQLSSICKVDKNAPSEFLLLKLVIYLIFARTTWWALWCPCCQETIIYWSIHNSPGMARRGHSWETSAGLLHIHQVKLLW